MSRIYLAVAALFAFAGILVALFAPTEAMGLREAFFARLLLFAPPIFIGTVISALAVIMRQLEQLTASLSPERGAPEIQYSAFGYADDDTMLDEVEMPPPPPPSAASSDFETFFKAEMRKSPPEAASAGGQEKRSAPAAKPEPAAWPGKNEWASEPDKKRAPTVDEYLAQGKQADEPPQVSAPVREGSFAGRRYRMFGDGSLEIDTDQSTIRFASLEEFRTFVSAAGKRD